MGDDKTFRIQSEQSCSGSGQCLLLFLVVQKGRCRACSSPVSHQIEQSWKLGLFPITRPACRMKMCVAVSVQVLECDIILSFLTSG